MPVVPVAVDGGVGCADPDAGAVHPAGRLGNSFLGLSIAVIGGVLASAGTVVESVQFTAAMIVPTITVEASRLELNVVPATPVAMPTPHTRGMTAIAMDGESITISNAPAVIRRIRVEKLRTFLPVFR